MYCYLFIYYLFIYSYYKTFPVLCTAIFIINLSRLKVKVQLSLYFN
jgi:hypothetical protein